jgi:hypothetical protein
MPIMNVIKPMNLTAALFVAARASINPMITKAIAIKVAGILRGNGKAKDLTSALFSTTSVMINTSINNLDTSRVVLIYNMSLHKKV